MSFLNDFINNITSAFSGFTGGGADGVDKSLQNSVDNLTPDFSSSNSSQLPDSAQFIEPRSSGNAPMDFLGSKLSALGNDVGNSFTSFMSDAGNGAEDMFKDVANPVANFFQTSGAENFFKSYMDQTDDTPLGMIGDITQGKPFTVGDEFGAVGNLAKDFGQAIPRDLVSLGLEAGNAVNPGSSQTYQPQGDIAKFLLGDQPVNSLDKNIADNPANTFITDKTGSGGLGSMAALPLVAAGTALDIQPLEGVGKKVGEEVTGALGKEALDNVGKLQELVKDAKDPQDFIKSLTGSAPEDTKAVRDYYGLPNNTSDQQLSDFFTAAKTEDAQPQQLASLLQPTDSSAQALTTFEDYLPKDYQAASDTEKAAIDYLSKNTQQAMEDYKARAQAEYGTPNVVSADLGKEVIPGMSAETTTAYHEAGSALSKMYYEQLLKDSKDTGNNTVLFTAGGSGSGKTTALKSVLGDGVKEYPIIYDTTMSSEKSAAAKIQQALDQGYSVQVATVYRDPVAAFEHGVLPRVRSKGRIVPLEDHAAMHQAIVPSVAKLQQRFGDKVEFGWIDNTGAKGTARVVDSVDKLPIKSYTKEELQGALHEKLQQATEANIKNPTVGISESEAKAIRNEKLDTENSRQPQSEPQSRDVNGNGKGNKNDPKDQSDKYAFNINKDRLNITDADKKNLTEHVEAIRKDLEDVKGRTLSNKEVVSAAKGSDLLTSVVDREKTKEFTASLTALRQAVSAGAEGKGVSEDFIKNLKVLSSFAADTGRKLQAFKIGADPELSTIKEQLIKDLLGAGHDSEKLIEEAKGVDFTNQKEVTEFYRKFVKPSFKDTITEYRYINLLSSPQTHIVNAFSNILQVAGVNPATKLVSGALDMFGSKLTGKEQEHYLAQVPAYYRGVINSTGEAVQKFMDALKGNSFIQRPDIEHLPTNSKVLGPLQFIPRALEAGDVFFRTMAEAGEKESIAVKLSKQGKEINDALVAKEAKDKANYTIFRQDLNSKDQGHVLQWIDDMTKGVYALRRVPGVSWFVPFVLTPMNIFKQGIEYSPLGLSTLVGAGDKTEQLAKSLVGSAVFAGAATAAQMGDSTWAAPTNQNDKNSFYASGRQAYSIKIGGQWVSYSKLGPLAYPMALAGAIRYYTEQDPKALTESNTQKLVNAIAGMTKFFSDQSYMQGIGTIVKASQGDETSAKQWLTNLPMQLVPLSSLEGWVARIIDPVYRKPDTLLQSMEAKLPLISKTVPASVNPDGSDSVRDNMPFNALSPIAMHNNNAQFDQEYQTRQQISGLNVISKNQTDQNKQTAQEIFTKLQSAPDQKSGQAILDQYAKQGLLNSKVMSDFDTLVKTTATKGQQVGEEAGIKNASTETKALYMYKIFQTMNQSQQDEWMQKAIQDGAINSKVLDQFMQMQSGQSNIKDLPLLSK